MAEMYKELAEAYQYTANEDGISGQKVFIRDDVSGTVAVASLPVVSTTTHTDPYGSNVGSCYCRSKTSGFVDGDPNTLKWTFSFNTKKPSAEGNPINNDPNNRRFRMGSELLTIEKPGDSNHYWSGGGSTDVINQKIWKRIVIGEFTIPKSNLTAAQNANFIGSVQSYVGKINSATFENFNIGQVYFTGFEGGTNYDNGNLRYNYEMHFEFMINPHTGVGSLDYLYMFKEATGVWDKPRDSAGNFLYGSADFNSLK